MPKTTNTIHEQTKTNSTLSKKIDNTGIWNKPAPWATISILLLIYIFFSQKYQIELNIIPNTRTSTVPTTNKPTSLSSTSPSSVDLTQLQKKVIPTKGVNIPIKWNDLGKQMVNAGVIDANKFRQLFGGQLASDQEAMLTGNWNKPVKINQQNSRFLLDLFWALGLGNKNTILTKGEMSNQKYGGAGRFASTGGWTLAKGKAMDHYGKHQFLTLSAKQQKLVEEVSKNIYRPCCGNSTAFPDCNHGMAMLGLLELMASQGATEQQMYDTALAVNSIWFPQTYLDLATYFKEQGKNWDQVDAKLVLGKEYSSAQGYATTRKKIKSLPKAPSGGGGCGV